MASFDNVGTTGTFKLGQIKPDDSWDASNLDALSTINALGLQDVTYTFYEGNWYLTDDDGFPTGDPVDDVALPINQGLVVYSGAGATLTFSGSVEPGDCEMFTTGDGYATYTGNFTPAPLMIGDIIPSDEWDASNLDALSTLNSAGIQEDS